jgi:hypothetical protein
LIKVPVRVAFRRFAYLWFLISVNLAMMIFLLVLRLIPIAGAISLLGLIMILLAVYYGSAARLNHIDGTTSHAWMGFIPFVNLWFMFKRGGDTFISEATKRSRLTRFVLDPILVITGIFVFLSINFIANN